MIGRWPQGRKRPLFTSLNHIYKQLSLLSLSLSLITQLSELSGINQYLLNDSLF